MTELFNGVTSATTALDGKSIADLLRYIADDDLGYRADATVRIAEMGIRGVYPELERALRDGDDADLRNGAMEMFVAFGKSSVPYLVKLLLDPDEEVRNFSCVMLGDIGNRSAVFPLIKALSDKDANVSHSAAEALGKIGDRSALFPLMELLKGDFWVQYSAIAAIGEMRDYRAVPRLLQMLDDELLTGAIIDALGKIGDPRALFPLGRLLPSLPPETAGMAARAMTAIYKAALDAVNYRNSLVEYSQPEHLRQVLGEGGVEKLRFLLKNSSDRGVVEASVLLLGWYGDVAAAVDFFALLEDAEYQTVVEAALLSMRGQVEPYLMQALEHDRDMVKAVALRTLRYLGVAGLGARVAGFLESASEELQLEAIEAVMGAPAHDHLPTLFRLMTKGSPQVAERTAELLGRYPYAAVKDFLRSLAAESSPEARMRAARMLCHIVEDGEPELLDRFLEDPDPALRTAALKAVRIHPVAVAAPRLGSALNDPDASVRIEAVASIAEFYPPILVEDVLAKLGETDEALDFAVIKALGVMRARNAENRLVEFLEKGNFSRRVEFVLLDTLGKIGAASASELIRTRYLASHDPDIRRLAVETLGQFGDTASLNAIEAALKDSHWVVRVAALHVMGKLGGIAEIPRIIGAIDDPDDMVRKHAILVLGDIRSVAAIPALVLQLADMDMSRHAFTALLKFGRQALPWLHRHLLKNYTVEIRVRLIDLIGKIGDRRSVEPLMELLEDASPDVRLEAIDSLAFCFDGLLLKKLSSLKNHDSSNEVRERADLALKTLTMEKYT